MTSLERICAALRDASVGYAIVGGHAVALHGAVRGTVDIDLVIRWTEETLVRAEAALKDIGLVPQLPIRAKDVFANRDDYIQNRHLVAWNFYNPDDPMEQVDIIITYDLATMHSQRLELPNGPVDVLSIDDLITMKRRSGRPQDLADVRALERLR